MNKELTPSVFRIILIISFIGMLALGVVLFIFGYQKVSEYAAESREIATQAKASSEELQSLSTLKTQLDKYSTNVARAKQIVSTSKGYYYQDQIVNDLNSYASRAGVMISSIDFSANYASNTSSSSSSSSSSTENTKKAPSGFKSVTANISLNNPVSYESIYNLLSMLENSLFRMQISNLTLARDQNGGVTVDTLTVEVYTR